MAIIIICFDDTTKKDNATLKKKDIYLIDFDGNRENNFTTLRIILAWSVLYGHGYAVQKIIGYNDPLNKIFLGSTWIGEVAVNGFFAISGFLVTASIIKRGVIDYSISRILRIFPALIVCIIFSVFVIGPLFTQLTFSEYFSDSKTYEYLKNATLYFNMHWTLPGVFENNIRNAVNGSLWTLPAEVRCYLFLAIVSLFAVFKQRTIANLMIFTLLVFGFFYFKEIPLISINAKWSKPSLFFLIGVFFYINRDKILINFRLALLALVLINFSFGQEWFMYVYPLALVYFLLYLVYATKYLKTDKKLGDISYGVYIYAWPIQQSVASLFPDFTPTQNTMLSTVVVFILAYTSWHYLEKPFLSLKSKILTRT
jgi:peptidoglycan/LPS O-acetylase OafA/YrhL